MEKANKLQTAAEAQQHYNGTRHHDISLSLDSRPTCLRVDVVAWQARKNVCKHVTNMCRAAWLETNAVTECDRSFHVPPFMGKLCWKLADSYLYTASR